MKLHVIATLAILPLLASGAATAGQLTTTVPVSATLVENCSGISASPLDFGTNPVSAVTSSTSTTVLGSFTLTVSCSTGAAYTLTHASSDLTMDPNGIYMLDANTTFYMALYKPNAGTLMYWPSTSSSDPTVPDNRTANAETEVLTVNAELKSATTPAAQSISGNLTVYLDF